MKEQKNNYIKLVLGYGYTQNTSIKIKKEKSIKPIPWNQLTSKKNNEN